MQETDGDGMSTHHIDLRLLPDPEFSHAHLLGALHAKLHRALVQLQASDIGVSFPQYSLDPRSLGSLVRLHGSEASLQRLMATDWLKGMRDHLDTSAITAIPPQVQYRSIQRRQFKTSAERLRRRWMRRQDKTPEQAAAAIPDSVQHLPDLPFIQLRSQSTGQHFHLFVALGPIEPEPGTIPGSFNSYGLANTPQDTIPWF